MSRLYREQTGRELSDYILVQQADKVVRYNQLPPDAEFVRRAVLNSCSSPASEATSDFSARFKARLNFGGQFRSVGNVRRRVGNCGGASPCPAEKGKKWGEEKRDTNGVKAASLGQP